MSVDVDIMSNLLAMASNLGDAAPAKAKAVAPKATPVAPAPVAAPVAVAVAPTPIVAVPSVPSNFGFDSAPVVLPVYAPSTVVPHVVLSNGETFCGIDGCKIILIPDDADSFTDEDMSNGIDLKTLYEAYVALQSLKALLS
jgi:hypothetical protein